MIGKPRLTKVVIDSVDVTSFIVNWKFEPTSTMAIKNLDLILARSVYASVPNLQTSPRALTVTVQRGVVTSTEDYVFRGEIVERQTAGNLVQLKCSDKLYKAVKKNVTRTFDSSVDTEAGKVSEIFKTLLTLAGLSHSSSSITDSGTVLIIRTFICNNADVFERLQLLAELLDWQFFYDPVEDLVFFQPKGSRAGTNTLTVGGNVTNRPKWIRDGKKVVETAKLFGGPTETATQETFSGDNNETVFTLTSIPVSVSITVGGVLQSGGVEGQAATGVDYFVDSANKRITFVVAPGIGVDNIVVDYNFLSPIAIDGTNPTVSEGIEATLRKPELTTVEDNQNYLNNFLLRHSEDFIKTVLAVTNVTDMDVGQTVPVVDTNEGIDQTFFINKIIKSFPYRFDEVQVDTQSLQIEDWNITVEDRLRRIEERLVQEETIVIFLKSFNRTEIYKVGRRYFKMETRAISNSMIWDHPTAANGAWGTALWGDRRGAVTLKVMQQGLNIYLEEFIDTDFKDATTTATWSGDGEIVFT